MAWSESRQELVARLPRTLQHTVTQDLPNGSFLRYLVHELNPQVPPTEVSTYSRKLLAGFLQSSSLMNYMVDMAAGDRRLDAERSNEIKAHRQAALLAGRIAGKHLIHPSVIGTLPEKVRTEQVAHLVAINQRFQKTKSGPVVLVTHESAGEAMPESLTLATQTVVGDSGGLVINRIAYVESSPLAFASDGTVAGLLGDPTESSLYDGDADKVREYFEQFGNLAHPETTYKVEDSTKLLLDWSRN